MKITTKVRYGMRAIVELAEMASDRPVRISELAERQKLSVKYLEALMVKLRNAGLVESTRGKNGGYELAKNPEQITAFDIFDALDESLELVPCICEDKICDKESFCGTQQIWKDLSGSMKNKLQAIKLNNLMRNEKERQLADYE